MISKSKQIKNSRNRKREFKKVLDTFFNSNNNYPPKEFIDSFITSLLPHKPLLTKLYISYLKKDKDYRSGEETYGYSSYEHIKTNLHYISDRWSCSFRIRYMLDLLDKDFDTLNF
jgi:hypothetical protein